MADLRVDLAAVGAVVAGLREVGERLSTVTVGRALGAVADVVEGGVLAAAARTEGAAWATAINGLARDVAGYAAAVGAAAEQLVRVDGELAGPLGGPTGAGGVGRAGRAEAAAGAGGWSGAAP